MLANIIEVLAGELNSGCVAKAVTDRTITVVQDEITTVKYYKPTQIRFTNSTGGTIHFLPINSVEYNSYVSSTLTTDLIPVATSSSMTIESIKDGEVTYMLVSGTSGHSSSLSITLFQE